MPMANAPLGMIIKLVELVSDGTSMNTGYLASLAAMPEAEKHR